MRCNASTKAQSFSVQNKRAQFKFNVWNGCCVIWSWHDFIVPIFCVRIRRRSPNVNAPKYPNVELKQNCFKSFYLSWNKMCPTTLKLFLNVLGTENLTFPDVFFGFTVYVSEIQSPAAVEKLLVKTSVSFTFTLLPLNFPPWQVESSDICQSKMVQFVVYRGTVN